MFAVIYQFNLKEYRESEFKGSWKQLTQLIYEYEGSLGSRLHKLNDTSYIAYAQWPDRDTWKNSGNNLPDSANRARKSMRDCCTEIATLYELDCTEDLLKTHTRHDGPYS
jgi:heme-degrading monooxygenase HmoA